MPKTKQQDPKAQPDEPATQTTAHDPIQSVLSLLADLGSSDAFQQLCSLRDVNNSLLEQNGKAKAAYEENLHRLVLQEQTIAQERAQHAAELESEQALRAKEAADLKSAREDLHTKQEETRSAQETIADYDARIQTLVSNNKAKDGTIVRLETDKATADGLMSDLSDERDRLKAENETLRGIGQSYKSLRSFLEELVPLEDRRAQVHEAFRQTFRSAHALMVKVLAGDLEQPVLADPKVWDTIRGHPSIRLSLPIPPSNSDSAKIIRVAAGLLIYSSVLCDKIFRPTYCVEDRGIDDALVELEDQDPLHEACARAMLLRILPEQQDRRRKASVADAVNTVRETLAGIVPTQKQRAFDDGLAAITTRASEHWQLVQSTQEKVALTFVMEAPDDWDALPTTTSASTNKSEGSTRQKTHERQRKQTATEQSPPPAQNLARAIWPALLGPNPQNTMELLCHGVGIPRDVVAAAEEEVSARANRRMQRQNTANGKPPRPRRDSGIFFSSAALDGSDKDRAP